MTPIVRQRRVNSYDAPPPPPPSRGQGAPIQPIEIKSDSPLVKLVQSTGRTPTHPLTAKASAEPKKVTPVDVQKAKQAFRQAEVHAKRGRLQETFEALQKAYLLNPESEETAAALSEILTVGGQAGLAHNLLSEFLERHPESLTIRVGRLNLSKLLIPQYQMMAAKSPEQEKEFLENAQKLIAITQIDQALIFQAQAPSIRKELEALEKNSDKFHGLDLEKKTAVLDQLQMQAEAINALAASPVLAGPEGAEIVKELKAVGKQTSDALLRFAEADSDPTIKREVPLLKANQALNEGRLDDALGFYETYRETECKALGNGDSSKGLETLKGKYQLAVAYFKVGNPAEAEKALEDIPPNLAMAHKFIEDASTAKLLRSNLAVLAACRDEITESAKAQRENIGALDQTWDRLWRPEETEEDKIQKQETKRLNLVSAVKARLETGKNKTIFEALKEIQDGSDAELKETALEVLATSGMLPFGTSRAGRLAAYGATAYPDKEKGAELLEDAKKLAEGDDEQKKAAAGIYQMVYLLSRDAGQKEEARKALKP